MEVEERNIVEITTEDLQRMHGFVFNNHHEKFLTEKLMLKALSDERAERWPNTIKALRMKRLQAKKEKFNRLEQERLKLDASEAAYKAEQRKQHIQKANKILSLPHMRKMLSKAHMNNIMQIEERREHQKEELKRKEWENEELKRLAEEEHAFKEYKDQLKQKRTIEMNKEMLKIAKEKETRQESERNRSQELDRQIEEYTVKKEKFMEERKNEKACRRALQEKLHESVIEKQHQAMLAAIDNTEACYRKQQAEKELEEDKKDKIKAERKKQHWEECDRSRKMQLQRKKKLQQDLVAEEISEFEQALKQCLQMNEELKAEEMDCFIRSCTVAEYNKKAMMEKMKKEQQDKETSIEEERHALERMEDDMKEVPLENLRL